MRDSILSDMLRKEFLEKYYYLKYITFDKLKPPKQEYKISICTNCMGMADRVKETYEKNIIDNIGYKNIEFVLLNYNSKDDLDDYVKTHLMKYIDKGILNYYKTTEPEFYSMTHSRNISFKVATGDIVNNVDVDHFINQGFAKYINILANQRDRLIFVKSNQKNRGRIGMFKKDFMWLGGYDEEIKGYGNDDHDLVCRAFHSGFDLVKFGGDYFTEPKGHRRHHLENYKNKDWKFTQRKNILLSLLKIKYGVLIANQDKHWGKAELLKNFKEKVSI